MQWLPDAVSNFAPHVDQVIEFVTLVSVIFFVLIVFLIVYFPLRYRRRGAQDVTPAIHGNVPLETAWTIIPTILVLVIFTMGLVAYREIRAVPDEQSDAYEVQVTAKMWLWQFRYPDGRQTINDLYVPLGRPVRVVMKSEDVIHSFYVPAFRTKQDVLPNAYTTLWFEATEPGTYDIFCTEYCGAGHSKMLGKVHVLDAQAWSEWSNPPTETAGGPSPELSPEELKELGARLFVERGCNACHTTDGSPSVGPSLKGLWGKRETLADGSSVVVDENYIVESLLEPQAKVVAGFAPVMPSFKGLLNEEEQEAIIAFIKSLK